MSLVDIRELHFRPGGYDCAAVHCIAYFYPFLHTTELINERVP